MSYYASYPPITTVLIVPSASYLPISSFNGSLAVTQDTSTLYEFNGTNWIPIATPGDVTAITALTGDVTATGPGAAVATLATVNSNVGSFGTATNVGTFTVNAKGLVTAASNTPIQITESQVTNLTTDLAGKQPTGNYITALTGDATATGPGSVPITLATVNSNVGTFGDSTHVSQVTANAKGLITAISSVAIIFPVTSVTASSPLSSSGGSTPNISFTGILAPANGGTGVANNFNLTIGGTSSINGTFSGSSSGTNTGDQTITLTGDVTGSGTGTFATTLATVNSNVGSFGSSTSIPSFTVNAKGLITAASGNVVIAPAGTLSGSTLNSSVVNSSLTSVGTITSGTWTGTTIAIANGGTGATTVSGARTNLGIDAGGSIITSGTTYTTPSSITTNTLFKFTLIGGGGGGGGFSAAGACASGGGAGGGGILWITGLTASTNYTIAIGAAGSAGIATTPGNAGSGGNTTLTIGATTYTAGGGTGSAGGASNVQGGAGGSTTNCTINIKGQNGNGSADNSPSSTGGGGNSPFGLGLGGASLGASSAGLTGTGFGAGGSGAHGSGLAGGAGTAGCIVVEYSN